LRYAEVSQKEMKFLDVTSLTVEEFHELLPAFEKAYQERMQECCLDGKKRKGRRYTTYANCPLPTAEDRLLFILVYLKTNVLQVIQGELFDMGQSKANQWIHALLPALQVALRSLGDAPARTMEQLANRLGVQEVRNVTASDLAALVTASEPAKVEATSEPAKVEATSEPAKVGATSESAKVGATSESAKVGATSESAPLFVMMQPSGVSNVPKILRSRNFITVERKNVTQ
jgi:Helix-turn-helix of DDE superfamily endonuclease